MNEKLLPQVKSETNVLHSSIYRNLISRRQFLKGAAVVSSVFLLEQLMGMSIRQVDAQTIEASKPNVEQSVFSKEMHDQAQVQQTQQISKEDEKPLIFDTVKEATVFTAGTTLVGSVVEAIGIPVLRTSKSTKKEITEKPLKYILEGVVITSPIEEGLFRLLPTWLMRDSTRNDRWEIGILTSILFAYLHNFQKNEQEDEYRFIKDKVPLQQFIYGMYFWGTMRKKGFSHAVAAHATVNMFSILVRNLFHKLSPDKKI